MTAALAPAVVPRVAGLGGRGMPTRLGPLLGLFARRFLDRIPFPHADRIRALAASGAVIVWVHRSRNPVEHLALARVVAREGLPRARYVGGLNVAGLQPFWVWPSLPKSAGREEELLARCVKAGAAAEIFLRRPMTLLSTGTGLKPRFMEALVQVQREMSRKIVLVPLFLAMKQRPGNFEPTTLDAIFGTVEEPGLLRAIGRVIAAGEVARFEVSEPVDLGAFVKEHEAARDDVIAKKVRWSILHHLARVERVAHGPPMKSHARMREEVLRDTHLQEAITQLAADNGVPRALLEKQARKMHSEIAARFDVDLTRLYSGILDVIWKRIYDGVHYDAQEVERLRAAARLGPLVLVPSHRSHVDYMVMSQVMLKAGLLPPLVAAGDNLSFFPLGPIFRRGGAYFLRRSFKGDVLYGAVFRACVRKLFDEGFTQEFFIEGGRSRTGKTLPPKLGLLSMLVDAYLESKEDDAIFLPCHISYERVIEASSYVGELAGKPKEKESATALVKTAGVLGGRYGRVYVTFDEPISLARHKASRKDDDRRLLVSTLAHKIVYGINRCGVVTSTSVVAASVFGLRKKGVDEIDLLRASTTLVAHLAKKPQASVRWQPGFDPRDPANVDAEVAAALARLVDDGLLTRAVAGERTLYSTAEGAAFPLDTFKNQLLHHVVPECIVAMAYWACGRGPVKRAALAEAARTLSRVFKIEFIYRVGLTFDELFEEAVENAVGAGLLATAFDEVMTPDISGAKRALSFARSLILPFAEAYHACLAALGKHPDKAALPIKQRVTWLLEMMKAQALAGELACVEAPSKAIVENAVALAGEIDAAEREEMLAVLEAARRG